MRKLLLFLLPALLAFSSCNMLESKGKKVTVGESEIYYKGDGVSEDDAQKVGDFLTKYKIISKKKKEKAQVTKEEGAYIVHLTKDADEVLKLKLWKLQYDLSEDVFDGKQARFALADDSFKDKEVLDPTSELKVGAGGIFYDSGEFKKSDAKKLADFLEKNGYMGQDKEANVFLNKEDDVPVVRFIYNKEYAEKNEETIMPAMSYIQFILQDEVLNDKKTKLLLTTVDYEDFKKVPKITADQKETFENQFKNQNNPSEMNMDSVMTQSSSGVVRMNNE